MTQNATTPAVGAAWAGDQCSALASSNNSTDFKPPKRPFQAEYSPATAPLILDLQRANVELDLRICAVKAVQAATDLEIGQPDDFAERNIRVAISHLKDAAKRFKKIMDAKPVAEAFHDR